jgi:hypothetical protein
VAQEIERMVRRTLAALRTVIPVNEPRRQYRKSQ